MAAAPAPDATYVAGELKAADPDRFYASLLLPAGAREAVQALYAFNAEVASVRDRVRDPNAGEIRLQWWADALGGQGHGEVHGNPLAAALLHAISSYRLPTTALQRLLRARRFDLYDDPMPDLPTFEGYAGETVSLLYQLAAMILNDGAEVMPGDAAGHLGVAHGLVGHLRAFGYNASRRRLYLPLAIFAANGVTRGEIFAGTVSEGLLAAQAQLVELAAGHLDRAEAAVLGLPPRLRSAFATLPLLQRYLQLEERRGEAMFAPPAEIAGWRRIAIMALWNWRVRTRPSR